jgi:hypothetical protein
MEIATLAKGSLRIKGKHSSLVIDPQDKLPYNAALALVLPPADVKPVDECVLIAGAGEYEIGGIKITGIRNATDMLYSIYIDSIECLVGTVSALEKMQHKLKEYNVVIVNCNNEVPASFLTSLAVNSLVCYGEKAQDVTKTMGQENIKALPKYQTTIDKLPSEIETVLLG